MVLVGGGIMSTTLGVLLRELEPSWEAARTFGYRCGYIFGEFYDDSDRESADSEA